MTKSELQQPAQRQWAGLLFLVQEENAEGGRSIVDHGALGGDHSRRSYSDGIGSEKKPEKKEVRHVAIKGVAISCFFRLASFGA